MNATPFPCTPAEIKLLLRMHQLAREASPPLVLVDLGSFTLSQVGQPEILEKGRESKACDGNLAKPNPIDFNKKSI
jgi:hypothetical protein